MFLVKQYLIYSENQSMIVIDNTLCLCNGVGDLDNNPKLLMLLLVGDCQCYLNSNKVNILLSFYLGLTLDNHKSRGCIADTNLSTTPKSLKLVYLLNPLTFCRHRKKY